MKKNKKKRSNKTKIILIIIGLILLLLIGYRVIFGEKNINANKQYDENRYYRLLINNNEVGIEAEEIKKIPIIPGIINIVYPSNVTYGASENNNLLYEYKLGSQILFDLLIYECFDNDKQVACTKTSQNLNKIIDKTYKIAITRSYENEEGNEVEDVLYNGGFIRDVSQYFPIKSVYTINITRSKGFVKTNITFNISMK